MAAEPIAAVAPLEKPDAPDELEQKLIAQVQQHLDELRWTRLLLKSLLLAALVFVFGAALASLASAGWAHLPALVGRFVS